MRSLKKKNESCTNRLTSNFDLMKLKFKFMKKILQSLFSNIMSCEVVPNTLTGYFLNSPIYL